MLSLLLYDPFWTQIKTQTCSSLLLRSAAFNMPANLENSAVATGLEKASFHLNTEKGQCQRIFKVPDNYTHFAC